MIDLEPSVSWATGTVNFDFEDAVTFVNRNSENLIIVAGDSWTYGNSLDPDSRLAQIYGNLISKRLDADLINIGFKGWSNSWILNFTNHLIQDQKQQLLKYNKVIVVVTLTENARDINSPHSFDFDYVSAYNTHGSNLIFYQNVLENIEQNWCKLINQIKQHEAIKHVIVSSNCVWHNVEKLQNTDKNWIEVIAEQGNYLKPIRTNMVSGWIFDQLECINTIANVKDLDAYKNFVLPYIEKANQVNCWLDASEYNSNKEGKHPDYRAHKFWADYLFTYLEDIL